MRISIFFIIVTALGTIAPLVQAEQVATEPVQVTETSCQLHFEIDGPTQAKVGSSYEYRVVAHQNFEAINISDFELKRNGSVIESVSKKEKYLRYFTTPGSVTLNATVTEPNGCEYSVGKEIRVYETMLVYVGWEKSWLESGVADLLEKGNTLYERYPGEVKLSEDENAQKIWGSLEQSDIIVIGYKDTLGFFSETTKFQKTRPIDFSKKRIYVVSDFSKAFLSKVIAASLSKIGATKVFLISNSQIYWLIANIASWGIKEIQIGEELSYEKTQAVYSLWGLLEFLAYAGFSYQLIAFLLSIGVAVLVLNVLKQIVWFNAFGIYYPVLFAIIISSLWFSGALLFLVMGFISITAVNLFSKKIHLLLHAKRSLLVGTYVILLLFALWVDNYFEFSFINHTIFDNLLIVFPLFIAVVLAEKIFQEDINIFQKSSFLDICQYAIITIVAYMIIEQQTLQYFLISYPDSIIPIVLLNILVGRYTGLQLFEYFRFLPVLRKLDEEE